MFSKARSYARRRLDTLATVDPETLPETTNPRFSFRYLDIACASEGRLTFPDTWTEFASAPSRARRVVRAGDVIMSTVRPNLRAFAYISAEPGPVIASTGFAVLRASDGVDPYFLLCSLLSDDVSRQIDRLTVGSNYPAINSSDVRRLLLPRPSKPTQQRIGSILASVDRAIEMTEALIHKYEKIKAGLMHDLFTRGVLPNGRLRPCGTSMKTPFGLLPSDWHLGSILELTDRERQPILTGPFGADLGNADFVPEGVPVLRIGNVQQGRLDLSDMLFVSSRKAESLSRYRVREGDLLFARQGATTGRNALADHRVDGSVINYHIIRIAFDRERCAPLFAEAAFSNEIIQRQIERDKGRGTREGINTAQLTSLAFPIAPVEEQRRIEGILLKFKRVIEAAQSSRETLVMQRLGLLQDLLTGKVPVKVDEPIPETADA